MSALAPRQTTTWHHDVVLSDGSAYPLRNRLSEDIRGDINDEALGLTAEQSRTSTAVHELGHALVWLASGLHVQYLGVGIGPGGQAACTAVTKTQQELMGRVTGVVAGERAQDRWLRETGLWTPDLAAMAELGAAHDRAYVFACGPEPRPGFGDSDVDYSVLHDLADEALDALWGKVMTALPILTRVGRMTGDELADHVGMCNGPALAGWRSR
ncbi:hypothetical protein PV724_44445 [Streptomyces europaeiscabiei]|uniref:hypothetical protein n=1 Tax=Streptomyces europaeiscabiei TaxID=146819 RepID=UPI0029A3498C|nr:hypothetical protein [Streptomyces europaeiscabiei]MDX3549528.1 hypothetical protein [Streptomyces europaeiscabiei]